MRNKVFYSILYVVLCTNVLFGQCIDRDSLAKHLQFLKNSSNFSRTDQLPVLLNYEKRVKNCFYRHDSTHALLLSAIAELYYGENDYLKALQYYRNSIEMVTAISDIPSVNNKELVRNYFLLSKVYESLNNVAEKMRALDSSAAIAIRLNDINLTSLWALYARVQYFFDVGDYQRCIEYAIMCERLGNEYASKGTEAMYRGGLIYASSSLHWHVNALLAQRNYKEAEKLLLNRVEENKKTEQTINLGTLYEQLAEVQAQNGNLQGALASFNQAFKHEFKRGNIIGCKTILNNIGYFIYFRNNSLDSSLYYYRIALGLKNRNESTTKLEAIESLNILNNAAAVFVQKGWYDSAYKYFQMAFDQIKLGLNENQIAHSSHEELSSYRKINYITTLLIDKGTAFHQQYKKTKKQDALYEAIRIYKLTDLLLDKIRSGQLGAGSKLFWRSNSRLLYEQAIESCYASGNMEDAFYFFEKSRAVLLNDQLNEQRWVDEEEILKQTQLKKRILQLQKEVEKTNETSARYRELQGEIFNNTQEMDRLVNIIKVGNPFYYQNYLDSGRVSILDVRRKILKDHQAIIEILNGDSAVYCLTITEKETSLNRIDRFQYNRLSTLYVKYLTATELLNTNFAEFSDISRQLYKLIFSNSDLPRGRIIISPDGNYFPYEALITSKESEPIKYLINDYAVSYTYSVRYLLNNFNTNSGNDSQTFLGIAPVNYPSTMGLAALPGSDVSLRALKSFFSGASIFAGAQASKANFMKEFGKYKIIQLYTHAADSGYNGEPVIWFADSVMLLSDLVYGGKNAAQLIVLSACETGTGKLYSGEGVFGFNRGFAALGIPSSVSNLWSVDNIATYKITELFYKYLSKGLPSDVALQKAKNEFRLSASKQEGLPYYWAASIFVGINNTIKIEKGLPWLWIITGIAITSVTIAAAFKIISKKDQSRS